MNRGIALTRNAEPEDTVYKRTYIWDEENRLKTTIDSQTVEYRYDSTGERTNKKSETGGETLYFNSMWLATEDVNGFRRSKNIFLGETRIATRLNIENQPSTSYEEVNTYYYHPDHLGSSNIVTTPDGEVFEHIEYAPYGETWIEKTDDLFDFLPYKFTTKELDEETGLYYYGARYLNPRTSRWISSDPAGFDLINSKRQGFNIIESNNWYSYVGNNPIKFIDPTGMESADAAASWLKSFEDAPDFSEPVDAPVSSEAGSREPLDTPQGPSSEIHKGWDYGPSEGETESYSAAADGEILATGSHEETGNYTILDHGEGWQSHYYHDDLPSMYKKGEFVEQGKHLGSMGQSGKATGPHLHFEIRKDRESIDPAVFFKRGEVMWGK